MDLSKYADILLHSRLFFPKAKLLGDPFESSSTRATVEVWNYIVNNKDSDPKLSQWKDMPKESLEKFRDMRTELNRIGLDDYFISCWHMNEFESAAMWSLYAKSDESICIVTDYKTLKENLPSCCFFGMVKYVDYDRHIMDTSNSFVYITHKRMSFEHEREIRAVIWGDNLQSVLENVESNKDQYIIEEVREAYDSINDFGTSVHIDLNKVVKEVYINPNSAKWFYKVVADLTDKFGYHFPVSNSSIRGVPVY